MNILENTKYYKVFQQIKEKIDDFIPEVCLILGSGLGIFAEEIDNKMIFPTSNLSDYPKSTVEGHKGNIIFGKIEKKNVNAFQGRIHFYEGYKLYDTIFPIILANLFGAKTLITTNVSGGINSSFKPGDIIFIDNHINFTFKSPIKDLPADNFNSDRSHTEFYDTSLLKRISEITEKFGIDFKKGTYLWTLGPSYETPAEIQAFKKLGADMVGMSTVPEVITASHLGMKVIGISLISNYASGISDQKLSHAEVIEISEKNKFKLGSLLKEVIHIL
jgi:purine-nucleoside phosphorylase